MRSQGTRAASSARLTPIDAEPQRVRAIGSHELDVRHADPLFEERLLRAQFRRERSSAYWFAASTWGIGALIVGACLGAFMMYTATVATINTAAEAYQRGQMAEQIQNNLARSAGMPAAEAGNR